MAFLLRIIPHVVISIIPPLDLRNRYGTSWAFISGGSSGIGRSFALKLAKQGFSIAILGTNHERLSSAVAALKEANASVQVRAISADLSDFDTKSVTQKVLLQLEGLDLSILFFNAGSHPSPNPLKELHTNIVTHQYLFHALYPRVVSRTTNAASQKRGAVLFTGSIAAFFPLPNFSVYGACKAYMGQFAESLAVEATAVGIDVVCVYPGPTHTLFGSRVPAFAEGSAAVELVYQSADRVAGIALSAVGRVVRADAGLLAVSARILTTQIADANVLLWGIMAVGKSRRKRAAAEKDDSSIEKNTSSEDSSKR